MCSLLVVLAISLSVAGSSAFSTRAATSKTERGFLSPSDGKFVPHLLSLLDQHSCAEYLAEQARQEQEEPNTGSRTSVSGPCARQQTSKDCAGQVAPYGYRCAWNPREKTCQDYKMSKEELRQSPTCEQWDNKDQCENQEVPGSLRCKWNNVTSACFIVEMCQEWHIDNLFHQPGQKPDNFLGNLWANSFLATIECAFRLGYGCGVGMGIHCFFAVFFCTFCCCCCFEPCGGPEEVGKSIGALMRELERQLEKAKREWDERQNQFVTAEDDDEVFDDEATDEWKELGTFKCEESMEGLLVKCRWKDQGFGELKGQMRASRRRGDSSLCTVDVFGTCMRDSPDPSRTFTSANGDQLVSGSQAGDTIVFEYTVGSGEGYALHIKYFEAIPNYGNGYVGVEEVS